MKVLAHAHTRWSYDGFLEPRELGFMAARRGFGAVLVSDHVETLDARRFEELADACRAVRGVHVIPGVERSFDGYHVCAFGITRWVEGDDVTTWARDVHLAGGLVSCAHPIRYRHRIPDDILAVADLVEVWNAHRRYNGSVAPDPRSWRLLRGEQAPIASQDVHRARDFSTVGILIADVDGPAAILEEIRAGRVTLAGRLVHADRPPAGMRAAAFAALQSARPFAWAAPVAAYRLARRLRGVIAR